MKSEFTILIADRNPHVRCFLKRELAAEGFSAVVADSALDLLRLAFGQTPVDLVLVDPDLPDMDPEELLDRLGRRIPPIPVVIHALPEEEKTSRMKDMAAYVEKGGHSIEKIKEIISTIRTKKAAPVPPA